MGWVLVVDDEKIAAESLVLELKSRRIRAIRSESADEALSVLRTAPLTPVAVVLEPMIGEAQATRLLDTMEADPVLRHARPLILTRAHNPIVPGRAAMIFRKDTDSDRLLTVVEALARNHGAQGMQNQLAVAPGSQSSSGPDHSIATAGRLTIAIDRSSNMVTELRLTGRSDVREPSVLLKPHFDRMLEDAAVHGKGLRVHFEELDYFNSSTLAFLIQFINFARERRVSLEVSFSETKKWQSVSFEALKRAMKMFERTESSDAITFVGLGPQSSAQL